MQGTSFGTKFEGLKVSMDLSDQIAGLYHAGSVGIIMSGWLGSMNYGVITANKLDKWLFEQSKARSRSRSCLVRVETNGLSRLLFLNLTLQKLKDIDKMQGFEFLL